jgi:DNA-binding response OmpR family regulator
LTRLLLVADESRIVTFVRCALKANGFAVDSAADGVQGLRMAATGRYDLMVVDLERDRPVQMLVTGEIHRTGGTAAGLRTLP